MEAVAQTGTVVSLTPGASAEIKSLLAKEADGQGKGLRVYIEPGGCSGLQYGMVFDEPRPGDNIAQFDGVSVFVDAISAKQLQGAVIDFSDALTGGGFKISNPNARQSCGCGKSFET
jgi:iron-sulfur cluster assembly protein/iron-sulfur cluster insertion protein